MSVSNERCYICGLQGGERIALYCDKCNHGFHLRCLKVPLLQVPNVREFLCGNCSVRATEARQLALKEVPNGGQWWPLGWVVPPPPVSEPRPVVHQTKTSEIQNSSKSDEKELNDLVVWRAKQRRNKVSFPLSLGPATVTSLGAIDTRNSYHDQFRIFSPGYSATWKAMLGQHELNFSAQILDGGQNGPLFRISTKFVSSSTQADTKDEFPENVAEYLTEFDAEGNVNSTLATDRGSVPEMGEDMEDSEERRSFELLKGKEEESATRMASELQILMDLNKNVPNVALEDGHEIVPGEFAVEGSSCREAVDKAVKELALRFGPCAQRKESLAELFPEEIRADFGVSCERICRILEGQPGADKCQGYVFWDISGASQRMKRSSLIENEENGSGDDAGYVFGRNLASNLREDLFQIWLFLGKFQKILQLPGIPSLESFEKSFLSPKPETVERVTSSLASGDGPSAIEGAKPVPKHFPTLSEIHVSLLKILLDEIGPEIISSEKGFLGQFSRYPNEKKLAEQKTVGPLTAGFDIDNDELFANVEKNNVVECRVLGFSDFQGDGKVFSCPINGITWPEVFRRYIFLASGISSLSESSGDLLRCIGGDGGKLLGNLQGIPAKFEDAKSLAEAEKHLVSHISAVPLPAQRPDSSQKPKKKKEKNKAEEKEVTASSEKSGLPGPEAQDSQEKQTEIDRVPSLNDPGPDSGITEPVPSRSSNLSQEFGSLPPAVIPATAAIKSKEIEPKIEESMEECEVTPPSRVMESEAVPAVNESELTAGRAVAPSNAETGKEANRQSSDIENSASAQELNFPVNPADPEAGRQQEASSLPQPSPPKPDQSFHTPQPFHNSGFYPHSAPATSQNLPHTTAHHNSEADWSSHLLLVPKMATNVGARIRNLVRAALDHVPGPPDWARLKLEWSISKEVYRGNAAGPTKRAAVEVLCEHRGVPLSAPSKQAKGPNFPPQGGPPPLLTSSMTSASAEGLTHTKRKITKVVKELPELEKTPRRKAPRKSEGGAAAMADEGEKVELLPLPVQRVQGPDSVPRPPGWVPLGTPDPEKVLLLCRLILRQVAGSHSSIPEIAFGVHTGAKGRGRPPAQVRNQIRSLDLLSVEFRVLRNAYGGSHSAFAEDMRLLFATFKRSHEVSHPLYRAANDLQNLFDTLYREKVLTLYVGTNFENTAYFPYLEKLFPGSALESSELPIDKNMALEPFPCPPCTVCGSFEKMEKKSPRSHPVPSALFSCAGCGLQYHDSCQIRQQGARQYSFESRRFCDECIPPAAAAGNDSAAEKQEVAWVKKSEQGREIEPSYWLAQRLGFLEYWEISIADRVALLKLLCEAARQTSVIRSTVESRVIEKGLRAKVHKKRRSKKRSRAKKGGSAAKPGTNKRESAGSAGEIGEDAGRTAGESEVPADELKSGKDEAESDENVDAKRARLTVDEQVEEIEPMAESGAAQDTVTNSADDSLKESKDIAPPVVGKAPGKRENEEDGFRKLLGKDKNGSSCYSVTAGRNGGPCVLVRGKNGAITEYSGARRVHLLADKILNDEPIKSAILDILGGENDESEVDEPAQDEIVLLCKMRATAALEQRFLARKIVLEKPEQFEAAVVANGADKGLTAGKSNGTAVESTATHSEIDGGIEPAGPIEATVSNRPNGADNVSANAKSGEKKSGSQEKSVERKTVSRCECLEPVWTNRQHCRKCHCSFTTRTEMMCHRAICTPWNPRKKLITVEREEISKKDETNVPPRRSVYPDNRKFLPYGPYRHLDKRETTNPAVNKQEKCIPLRSQESLPEIMAAVQSESEKGLLVVNKYPTDTSESATFSVPESVEIGLVSNSLNLDMIEEGEMKASSEETKPDVGKEASVSAGPMKGTSEPLEEHSEKFQSPASKDFEVEGKIWEDFGLLKADSDFSEVLEMKDEPYSFLPAEVFSELPETAEDDILLRENILEALCEPEKVITEKTQFEIELEQINQTESGQPANNESNSSKNQAKITKAAPTEAAPLALERKLPQGVGPTGPKKIGAQSFPILQQLKKDILDMECAMGFVKDGFSSVRGLVDRRRAWRKAVKEATTVHELSMASVLLEQMLNVDNISPCFRFWSSVHAAMDCSTLSSIALRIHALDDALIFHSTATKSAPKKLSIGAGAAHP